MNPFNYFQPTEIIFGSGRIEEIGEVVSRFGKRCLLVTTPQSSSLGETFTQITKLLNRSGIVVEQFDGVIPNPTTETVAEGAHMAKTMRADVILGVGGGSSMDTAKAIAVEATHEGSCWDYLFFKTPPTPKTLPILTVSTTSGTGSHVTQVAVVTETKSQSKSALYHDILLPKVALIDPKLMMTVPPKITAFTGFDAFCHAFESLLHPDASPYTDLLAREAITLVINNLPSLLENGFQLEKREAMAWADTLAGLCIKSAGVTLPHGIGMAIGGLYPHVMHGESLAMVYPAFTRFTYAHAVPEFAFLGRILNPSLEGENDAYAAEMACGLMDQFLQTIGLWKGLKSVGILEFELDKLAHASMVLPDYKNNPKVPNREEILHLLQSSFERD